MATTSGNMDGNTVYLITGCSSGIGLGLAQTLLSRPNTTVIATVRNSASVEKLKTNMDEHPRGANSVLAIVALDLTQAPSPDDVRSTLAQCDEALGPNGHIDVLINNAGFTSTMTSATATTAPDLRACFETNTIAPLTIFQGIWPLLQKSPTGAPKVINISSTVGIIAAQEAPGGAYGPSKAALNWLTRAMHEQNGEAGLVAVAVHPGWVRTKMGEAAKRDWGYPHAVPETVEGSVRGIVEVVDGATRESAGGKFLTYKGDVLPW